MAISHYHIVIGLLKRLKYLYNFLTIYISFRGLNIYVFLPIFFQEPSISFSIAKVLLYTANTFFSITLITAISCASALYMVFFCSIKVFSFMNSTFKIFSCISFWLLVQAKKNFYHARL